MKPLSTPCQKANECAKGIVKTTDKTTLRPKKQNNKLQPYITNDLSRVTAYTKYMY